MINFNAWNDRMTNWSILEIKAYYCAVKEICREDISKCRWRYTLLRRGGAVEGMSAQKPRRYNKWIGVLKKELALAQYRRQTAGGEEENNAGKTSNVRKRSSYKELKIFKRGSTELQWVITASWAPKRMTIFRLFSVFLSCVAKSGCSLMKGSALPKSLYNVHRIGFSEFKTETI